MDNIQSINLVEVSAVPIGILEGGSFTFSIPSVDSNLVALGQFIQKGQNGDYVYWANLADSRGYLGISSNSTGKVVYVLVDGQHYMMYLLSNRYNALVRINSTPPLAPQLCPPELTPPSNITFENNCDFDQDCHAVVSVLVLVTPEASNWLGSNYGPLESELYVLLGLHTVNFALINSGVYNKSVRFITEPYDFNFPQVPDPDIADDLEIFENDPIANNLRNATRADLMMLLTDSRYFPYLGAVLFGTTGPTYAGFVSMEHLFAPWFTFAHELGHCFKLNHNRVSNGGDVSYNGDECPFGWRFHNTSGYARKSIMAIMKPEDIEPGAVCLLNYSNPNISFDGIPTGTSTDYNARQASHTMCEVDDYFYEEELRVDIIGPEFVCDETVSYSANITLPEAGVQGVGPYSVLWRVNDSEFFSLNDPGTLIGNSNPIVITSGMMPTPVFWLYVSVSSADGVVVNDIMEVDNPCGVPVPLVSGNIDYILPVDYKKMRLFPNPATNKLHVQILDQSSETDLSYTIINTLGEIVIYEKISFLPQILEIDLKSHSIPQGVYYFYFQSDTSKSVYKFIFHP